MTLTKMAVSVGVKDKGASEYLLKNCSSLLILVVSNNLQKNTQGGYRL